jgi:hypothetical protein
LAAVVLVIAMAGCGGGPPPRTAALPPSDNAALRDTMTTTAGYAADASSAAGWIGSSSVRSDGALSYTSQAIQPYYGNIAALGLAKAKMQLPVVGNWMRWYIAHLNGPDKWGLTGTIYDYNIATDGSISPTLDADSTDSYAATFLSLARAYYESGDSSARAYVLSIRSSLATIAGVITATQQSNGLTIAKPDYPVRYVMDNAEVYRGVADYAALLSEAWGDAQGAQSWNAQATRIAHAIETDLWNARTGSYWVEMDNGGGKQAASWGTWYPDATAQLFPIVHGVTPATGTRARNLYAAFNAHYPSWDLLKFPDSFPWAVVSGAAIAMSDRTRASVYVNTVQRQYAATGFTWPWYDAEAGWFIRTSGSLAGIM